MSTFNYPNQNSKRGEDNLIVYEIPMNTTPMQQQQFSYQGRSRYNSSNYAQIYPSNANNNSNNQHQDQPWMIPLHVGVPVLPAQQPTSTNGLLFGAGPGDHAPDATKLEMMGHIRLMCAQFKRSNYCLIWVLFIVLGIQIIDTAFPSDYSFNSSSQKSQYTAATVFQILDIALWMFASYFAYSAIDTQAKFSRFNLFKKTLILSIMCQIIGNAMYLQIVYVLGLYLFFFVQLFFTLLLLYYKVFIQRQRFLQLSNLIDQFDASYAPQTTSEMLLAGMNF